MRKSESKIQNKPEETINTNTNIITNSSQNLNPNFNSNQVKNEANKSMSYWDEENSRKLANSIITG
jgi:hypothetical protein